MLSNILIVEDDELVAMRYALFLRSKNVEVICAHSLAEAKLELSRLLTIDAVIVDNHLGDGEGLSLLSLIRRQFIDCPVVMISSESEPEFFIEAFAEGIDNYLMKPVNLDLLWIKLQKSHASYQLKRLNELHQQKMAAWVDQEKREHQLASHVFDSLIGKAGPDQAHLQIFSQSSSTFCGDLVLQQTGMDGSYYLMLADSMGHGLAAAIALLPVIEVFQAMSRKGLSLSHLVFEINDKLLRQLPADRFVAAVFVRVDPHLQQIQIWNGGMPTLFLLDKSGALVAEASSRHMALGILSEQQVDLSCQVVPLADVERIVGYTDGFTDNVCKNGQQLDRKAILQLSQQHRDLHAFEQCLDSSAQHQDDMTIFSLLLPALLQYQYGSLRKTDSSGALRLNMRCEGRMLKYLDVSNQIVRMLQVCDMPQQLCTRSFAVLTELFLNALEHGVLGLSSQLKQEENGFVRYYEEKETRLEQLSDHDAVDIALRWQAHSGQVELIVKDSGPGFLLQQPSQQENEVSGRGLEMIRSLCSEVEYRGNGNEVRVVING